MTLSSKTSDFTVFNQKEYNNSFYCCDNNHVFIAFTTCYCPLCDLLESMAHFNEEAEDTEVLLNDTIEQLQELTFKVRKVAPELLI